MKTRAITGVLFVIVMVGSVLLGPFVFSVFFWALSTFCLYEFYKLVKQNTASPDIKLGLLNGILLFAAFVVLVFHNTLACDVMGPKLTYGLLFILPLTSSAILIRELFKNSSAPFSNIAYTYVGIVLTIVPFIFFFAMAFIKGTFNYHFPLAFLIMLWSNDTGAYLIGRQFGKTKLFERHSPKKTWEGFIGGIIISVVAALILGRFYEELKWNQWVSVAVLISCFGTLGDLVESMFKRSINVKDSGGILPGHGGLLDRFDGLFIAAPVVYTYLFFIGL